MFVGSSWQYSRAHKMTPQLGCQSVPTRVSCPRLCEGFDKLVVTVQVDVGVSVSCLSYGRLLIGWR